MIAAKFSSRIAGGTVSERRAMRDGRGANAAFVAWRPIGETSINLAAIYSTTVRRTGFSSRLRLRSRTSITSSISRMRHSNAMPRIGAFVFYLRLMLTMSGCALAPSSSRSNRLVVSFLKDLLREAIRAGQRMLLKMKKGDLQ
jgi:hypothetical protein